MGISLRSGAFVALSAAAWATAGPAFADGPTPAAKRAIAGRVVDESGKGVAAARVRLYRRESRWDRRNAVVEEVKAGPDGAFRLATTLDPVPAYRTRNFPRLVLVADAPGLAVGWRIIPDLAASSDGDIVLTPPAEPRTIAVTDADGKPVAGATVFAYGLGDPESPLPAFREYLDIRGGEDPLAVVSDAGGHARFDRLPRTQASFLAAKPGFAATYAFRDLRTIRLTPSASLRGTVTGPDGAPVAGATVVLRPASMYHFFRARTDARGRYQFDDLMARGWDMGTWQAGKAGDGAYTAWIESERFAAPAANVTLEPKSAEALDIHAVRAATVWAKVVLEGTDVPTDGVRVQGSAQGVSLDGYTGDGGVAAFRVQPGQVTLFVSSPPPGVYTDNGVGVRGQSSEKFEVDEGEFDLTLAVPKGKPLIAVGGRCTLPDGSPSEATVSASAGRFHTATGVSYIRPRRSDASGRFALEEVPSARSFSLYAETKDGRFAGSATDRTPDGADPEFRLDVSLKPTGPATVQFVDEADKPLASFKVTVMPRVGDQDFPFLRRAASTDAKGMLGLDRVVPGLSYHFQEATPDVPRGTPVVPGGARFDQVMVLRPEGKD